MEKMLMNNVIAAETSYKAAVALKSAEVGIKTRLAAIYAAETELYSAIKKIFAALDSGDITIDSFGADNAQMVDDIITKRGIQIL